eukprot:5683896-Lingulodinium_polyedra.AAC.1
MLVFYLRPGEARAGQRGLRAARGRGRAGPPLLVAPAPPPGLGGVQGVQDARVQRGAAAGPARGP